MEDKSGVCSTCKPAVRFCEESVFREGMSEDTKFDLLRHAAGFPKRVNAHNSRQQGYRRGGIMRTKGEPSPHFRFRFRTANNVRRKGKWEDGREMEEKMTERLLNAGAKEWQIIPSLPSPDEIMEAFEEVIAA